MRRDYKEIAARASFLPDDALILDGAAALLLGVSVFTLRRHDIVPPIQVSDRCRCRKLGDIRAYARTRSHSSNTATA